MMRMIADPQPRASASGDEIASRMKASAGIEVVIGRETVQYVSNIFKYYVAYKLALEKGLQPKPV